jgi:hypothetical protein
VRTQATLDAFVQALQVNCGDFYDACKRCAVSPMFMNTWMKDDKEVQASVMEAERVGALALQSEAIRRAVHGDEKGVYFKGERIDTEYVKSDGLLQTLLKGRMREVFAPDADSMGGNTFNGPTQINVMPRANTYDEWLRMKDSTLTRRDALDAADRALPAPTLELEAMPIPRSPLEGLGL